MVGVTETNLVKSYPLHKNLHLSQPLAPPVVVSNLLASSLMP